MLIVTRIATLGLAVATFAGAIAPCVVRAQTGGKILVVGSLAEPDTFLHLQPGQQLLRSELVAV